jgi:hypothetical protein
MKARLLRMYVAPILIPYDGQHDGGDVMCELWPDCVSNTCLRGILPKYSHGFLHTFGFFTY